MTLRYEWLMRHNNKLVYSPVIGIPCYSLCMLEDFVSLTTQLCVVGPCIGTLGAGRCSIFLFLSRGYIDRFVIFFVKF